MSILDKLDGACHFLLGNDLASQGRLCERLNALTYCDLLASYRDYSSSGVSDGLRGMINSERSVRKLLK